MRYLKAFGLVLVALSIFVGCGATAVHPSVASVLDDTPEIEDSELPPPTENVLRGECFEMVAPAGWRLIESQAVRSSLEGDETANVAVGIFEDDSGRSIRIGFPHGVPGLAIRQFESIYMVHVVRQMQLESGELPEELSDISRIEGTDVVQDNTIPGFFYAWRVTTTDGQVRRIVVVLFQPREDTPEDMLLLSVVLNERDPDELPAEVIEPFRTIRWTCGD